MRRPPVIALLGLGEAGAAIAADLVAAGARVSAWDPDPARCVEGVAPAGDAAGAVAGTDAVLSVNAQAAALAAARAAAPALTKGCVYADANTSSAAVKRAVAAVVERAGAAFADIALLGPVPGSGLRTPALVSGAGAERLVDLLRPLGARMEVVGAEPGDAASRKLIRSVFMKGLAAAVVESLAAARAAGCEQWLRADLETMLRDADESVLRRLEDGSVTHAARRVAEMEAAAAQLRELGVEPYVAEAAAAVLRSLRDAAPPPPCDDSGPA
jgi:3-hydroxyisobutyrate dehydrogenase-like beta-hydroxyacid dehydrogenase